MSEDAREAQRGQPVTPKAPSDVFISYASQDKRVAEAVCKALGRAGVTCWIASRDVTPGEFYAESIVHAIDSAKVFLLVLSGNAATSQHVLREVERASSKRRPVVSFRIDLAPLPPGLEYFLNTSQWLDASPKGVDRSLPKLVDAVLNVIARSSEVARVYPGPPASTKAWQRPSRMFIALAVIIMAALAYVLADHFLLSGRDQQQQSVVEATPAASADSSAVPTILERSVAVLPFVDVSERRDQEYFSDGLSEELIELLAKIPDLRVPARTSSFYFKGKNEELASIARQLMVAHVLEGSVRKSGRNLRIIASLIRADSGLRLWSETYERELDDVFKVQDEIAAAVVGALKLKLLPDPKVVSVGNRTTNPAAHTQYLLGRQFFNRTNTEDFRRAVAAYEQAIALDPNYASAYAGLAVAENELSHDPENSLAEVLAGQQRALAAADRAIAIGPELAEGYAARGFLRFTIDWDWKGAEADLSRALALDPGSYRAYTCYACFLAGLGRLSEALEINEKAIGLDPLSADTWFRRSTQLNAAGRLPEARKAAMRALEISPEHAFAWFNLGTTSLLERNPKAALAEFRKASKARREAGVAMAEHDLGNVKESQRALDALVAGYASTNAYQVAEVFAWRGQRNEAFTWLERAHAQHDGILVQIKFDPLLANLHSDPRFAAMLKKMGLPP